MRWNRGRALLGRELCIAGVQNNRRFLMFRATSSAPRGLDLSDLGRFFLHFPNLFELN